MRESRTCILEKSTAVEGMADSKTLRWQWAWCVEDNCGSGEVSGVLRVRVGCRVLEAFIQSDVGRSQRFLC